VEAVACELWAYAIIHQHIHQLLHLQVVQGHPLRLGTDRVQSAQQGSALCLALCVSKPKRSQGSCMIDAIPMRHG
jgi:hypothetical protein